MRRGEADAEIHWMIRQNTYNQKLSVFLTERVLFRFSRFFSVWEAVPSEQDGTKIEQNGRIGKNAEAGRETSALV